MKFVQARGRESSLSNVVAHGLLAAGIGLSTLAAQAAGCKVSVQELPVTMKGRTPIVAVRINDVPVDFLLDSGAFYSMIAPSTADRFKLRRRPAWNLRIEGLGGATEAEVARIERFGIGKVEIPNLEFVVGGNDLSGNAVGILGQNVLGIADIEYDLPDGAVRIFQPGKDCENTGMAYWAGTQPVIELELDHVDRQKHTLAKAELNDHRIRVLFDTGAQVSLLSRAAARRAGIDLEGPGVESAGPMSGIGSVEVPTWIVPVRSFVIGGERISNTHLRVGEFRMPGVDMIIGVDYLLSHRLYVANSQDRIYMTYTGGPAFDLGRRQPPAQAAANAASGAAPSAPSPLVTDDGADAATRVRRASALASRGEFALALADLDRACAMEPDAPECFKVRGTVHLELGNKLQALADLGTTLRLDPGDAESRLLRARLQTGWPSGPHAAAALVDLAWLDRTLTPEQGLRRGIAVLYMQLGRPELALLQFDRWVAAHPDDIALPQMLGGRCRARALLARELEMALRDCDTALRRRSEEPELRDSRGLVHLRRGEFAKAVADYDAALRMDPRQALSLYGRGVARSQLGDAVGAQADFTAALAMRPTVAKEAQHWGIVATKAESLAASAPPS